MRVSVNWDGADATPVNPATLCIVQPNALEIVLTFGYFALPIALALNEHTHEEIRELLAARAVTPSQITRVSLPAEQALAMARSILEVIQTDDEEKEQP